MPLAPSSGSVSSLRLAPCQGGRVPLPCRAPVRAAPHEKCTRRPCPNFVSPAPCPRLVDVSLSAGYRRSVINGFVSFQSPRIGPSHRRPPFTAPHHSASFLILCIWSAIFSAIPPPFRVGGLCPRPTLRSNSGISLIAPPTSTDPVVFLGYP